MHSVNLLVQQNFGISNFSIPNFRFYRTTVNGPATVNANKCIWLISNLVYIEPLTLVPWGSIQWSFTVSWNDSDVKW